MVVAARRLPDAPEAEALRTGVLAAASGLFGVPLGFVMTIAVSLVTRAPSLARREVTDAIRRPNPDPILEDHAT